MHRPRRDVAERQHWSGSPAPAVDPCLHHFAVLALFILEPACSREEAPARGSINNRYEEKGPLRTIGKVAPFEESRKSVVLQRRRAWDSTPEVLADAGSQVPGTHLHPFTFLLAVSIPRLTVLYLIVGILMHTGVYLMMRVSFSSTRSCT